MSNVKKIMGLNQIINEAMTHDEAIVDSAKKTVDEVYKELNDRVGKLKKEISTLKKKADKNPIEYAGLMRHYSARLHTLQNDMNYGMKRSISNNTKKVNK